MSLTVYKTLQASVYDGSNGSQIASEMGFLVASDDGENLVIEGITVPAGHYLVWARQIVQGTPQVVFEGVFDATTYALLYGGVAVPVISEGSTNINASTLGGNRDFNVTLSPAMPTNVYVVIAQIRGPAAIIGGHSIVSTQIFDEDTVRITVNSAAASLAGGNIHVTALAIIGRS